MASRSKPAGGGSKWTGSRVSEVDVLEREAKEMEMQLKALQSRMQQQQMEDEAVVKTGGCRWKSARPDKGTVLSYAKDVQEKYRNKYGTGEDPAQWAPPPADVAKKPRAPAAGAGAGAAAAPPAGATFQQKDIDAWAIADVSDWLRSVRLDGYVSSFAVNEISGPVLLDIGLDDLDYMGVTVLAHRKLILKGIEDLRKNKRVTIQQQAAVVAAVPPAAKLDGGASNTVKGPAKASAAEAAAAGVVHWSHLEPLSSHEVSSSSSRFVANAADEEPGFLDEAAERAAFQAALASWRNEGKGPVKIIREGDADPEPVGKMSADDGMWRNPFAAPSAADQDDDMDLVGGSDRGAAAASRPDPFAGGPSLMEGALDEKAEHDEFVKAVEAWRNRDKPVAKPSSTVAAASAHTSSAAASTKPSSTASSAALAMAAKLAQDMESEQAEFALRVQREKEAAARRLEEARREDVKKAELDASSPKVVADVEFDCLAPEAADERFAAEAKFSPTGLAAAAVSRAGYDPRVGKLKIVAPPPPRTNDAEAGSLSPAACSVDDDGFDDAPAPAKTPRSMTICLLESKLGSPGKKEQMELESAYVVDEGDDDD